MFSNSHIFYLSVLKSFNSNYFLLLCVFIHRNHCIEIVDIIHTNKTGINSIQVDLKPEMKAQNYEICGPIDQIKTSIVNIRELNNNKVVQRLNESYKSKTEIFTNFIKGFEHYLISDDYSIKKDDFKLYILPRLLKTSSNNPKIQSCALLLLEKILFDDWKLQKSKLTVIALKASLIPQLIKLYDSNNDIEIQQSINRLYLLLFFVIAKDNKKVKKLILNCDQLLTSIIRNLNETNDIQITKDALLLMQFFAISSKTFEILSPILSSLIKFIKHEDQSIVSQSCYTLLIFSHNCSNARMAIINWSIINKLVDLLLNCDSVHNNPDEDIITPIIGLMMTLLPLFNRYKNAFLNANILSIITKYAKSCQCQRRYACDLIKFICMNPICSKLDTPTPQIQQVIDSKTLLLINSLLENDENFDVKLSALNAIFVTAYKATTKQLKQLAEQGCLKSLCSQLECIDYKYLYQTLITIIVFLSAEFKDILTTKKMFPNPEECLSDFAQIINKSDGIRKLKIIVEREKAILKKDSNNRESERVRIAAEEILIYAFGIETRSPNRMPGTDIMKYKKSFIDCVGCKKKSADTILFPCEHVVHCYECATKSLYKPSKCPVCKEVLPPLDTPWTLFKVQIFMIYKGFEDEILFESV